MEIEKFKEHEQAIFKAQYYGQFILKWPDGSTFFNTQDKWVDGDYLELRPLSSISDEDAIEVAKIWAGRHYDNFTCFTESSFVGNMHIHDWKCVRCVPNGSMIEYQLDRFVKFPLISRVEHQFVHAGNYNENGTITVVPIFPIYMLQIIDYLRSISHALPWNGHTVEEMQQLGWLKLKE